VVYHIKIDTRASVNRIQFSVVDGSTCVNFSSLYQLHSLRRTKLHSLYQLHSLRRTKLQSDLRIGSGVVGSIVSKSSLNAIHKQPHKLLRRPDENHES